MFRLRENGTMISSRHFHSLPLDGNEIRVRYFAVQGDTTGRGKKTLLEWKNRHYSGFFYAFGTSMRFR